MYGAVPYIRIQHCSLRSILKIRSLSKGKEQTGPTPTTLRLCSVVVPPFIQTLLGSGHHSILVFCFNPARVFENQERSSHGMSFASRLVRLGAQVRSGRPALREEAGENWMNKGAEDYLSTTVLVVSLVSNGIWEIR